MKIELHCHTSRYSACATAAVEEILPALIESGYEAVYLTDHDAVWDPREVEELRKAFPRIRIFAGVERSFPGRMEHLVVLGTSDEDYLRADQPAEVVRKAQAEGHLTVLAHPFRWEGGDRALAERPLPDAIELATGSQSGPASLRAERKAAELGLPLVNAGDVHRLDEIARYWIETDRPVADDDDIRGIILEGAYRNCVRV